MQKVLKRFNATQWIRKLLKNDWIFLKAFLDVHLVMRAF